MVYRKIIYNLLACTMSLLISFTAGCSHKKKTDESRTVLSSFFPVHITLLNLLKDVTGIESALLTGKGSGCLHDYQLTPADMSNLEKADCIVINGAGMESFMDDYLYKRSDITIIDASANNTLLHDDEKTITFDSRHNHEHHHDHNHEHHHHETVNPHVWLSPSQYIIQIQTITSGLCSWDTANAALYRKNGNDYVTRVRRMKDDLDSLLRDITHRDIITFHSAFSYLASDYDLTVQAVIQQIPGQEPSAAELIELIKIIKSHNIRSVFVEPQYHSKTAEVLSRETGVRVDTLDPVVTGNLNPDAYINAMLKNGQVLHAALSGDPQ